MGLIGRRICFTSFISFITSHFTQTLEERRTYIQTHTRTHTITQCRTLCYPRYPTELSIKCVENPKLLAGGKTQETQVSTDFHVTVRTYTSASQAERNNKSQSERQHYNIQLWLTDVLSTMNACSILDSISSRHLPNYQFHI